MPWKWTNTRSKILPAGTATLRASAAEHARDLVAVVPDTELVKTLAESLEPLGTHEVNASYREYAVDCCVQRDELEVRQAVDELLEGDGAVI